MRNYPAVKSALAVLLFLAFQNAPATGWASDIIWDYGYAPSPAWRGVPYSVGAESATTYQEAMGNLGGVAYDDFNSNGTFDTGELPIEGVVVSVYGVDSPTVPICSETTDGNGAWACVVPDAAGDYRVEFTNPNRTYLEAAGFGPDNGSNVQFINAADASAQAIDFGSVDPGAYCPTDDLRMGITCFVNGQATTNLESVVAFDYGASQTTVPANAGNKQNLAGDATVGATWGLAWARPSETLYAAAVTRRHVAYGPNGPGGIYQIDYSDPANPVASSLMTVANAGATAHVGLPNPAVDPNAPSYDLGIFAAVGKEGLGDIDVTDDGRTLYVTNLNTRSLVEIDVASRTETAAYPLPASLCDNAVEVRPFAVKLYRGEVYVGLVCSGEAGGALEGYVVQLTDAGTFTTLTSVDLSYAKDQAWGFTGNGCGEFSTAITWNAWNEGWPLACTTFGDRYLSNEQPILADIEFDTDGSMILGITDRFGLMSGPRNYSNDSNDGNLYFPLSGGDILRFCNVNGTLIQEGNPGCAYNADANGDGEEYYSADDFIGSNSSTDQHYENSLGGLALVPYSGEVIFSCFDPVEGVGFNGNANVSGVNTGGVRYADNATGDYIRGLQIYRNSVPVDNSPDQPTFGKTAGLGDLELFCPARPLLIGNRVWFDENNDGIQGADEDGIPNLPVELWLDPDGNTQGGNPRNGDEILVATTTTDADGRYIFSRPGDPNSPTAQSWRNGEDEVRRDTFYQLSIPNIATQASVLALTPDPAVSTQGANTGAGSSLRDSDAYDDGSNASVAIATSAGGQDDFNFDVGIAALMQCDPVITSLIANCTFDPATGANSFTLDLTVMAMAPPAGEQLVVSFNGNQIGQATPDPSGSTTFTNLPLTESLSFDNVLLVTYETSTECFATTLVDLIACTPDCSTGATSIGGNVFNDPNNDGADAGAGEGGRSNVLVQVYDCAGNLTCEVYTNAEGNWSCNGLTPGEDYRVEFTTPLQPFLLPSFAGADNGTDVQFAQPGTCEVDYSVIDPDQFCDDNPTFGISCYIVGDPNSSEGPSEAFITAPYSSSGRYAEPSPDPSVSPPTQILTKDQIGTVWGTDHDRLRDRLFMSALLKRNYGLREGLATNPLGAIYVAGTDGSDFGLWAEVANPGAVPTNAARGLGSPFAPSFDPVAYGLVGKVGLGDLEVSSDNSTLYTVNLATKELIRIPINLDGSPGAQETFPIPLDLCGNPADARPWGLSFREGKLYVGVTCTAESTGDTGELSMGIYIFDPETNTFTANPFVQLPLDYPRGLVYQFPMGCDAEWQPWSDDFRDTLQCSASALYYPSPVLSDIEFADDGSIILGLMDRFGLQQDFGNYGPEVGNTMRFILYSAGDLLKLCENASGQFEYCEPVTPNDQGPNGGEFYFEDGAIVFASGQGRHEETTQGGVAVLPGSNEVVVAVYDPFDAPDLNPPASVFNEGGIKFFDNTTGAVSDRYLLYNSAAGNGSKGIGLGDVELFCALPPIQIGNYAWIDENADGIQDPCEVPLPGLMVKLYRKPDAGAAGDPVLVATDVTDPSGNYYFSSAATDDADTQWLTAEDSIVRGATYFVAFCGDGDFDEANNSISIGGAPYCVAPANTSTGSGNDRNDSDITAQAIGSFGTFPAYCTVAGEINATNHTFDAGFKRLCPFVDLLPEVPPLCSTDSLSLVTAIDSVFAADLFIYEWSTDGTGQFIDAAGNPTVDFTEAVSYVPSAADGTAGSVTLTLMSTSGSTPADCEVAVDSLEITILNANCGDFFWDGQD